jgi:hypothetical protein
MVTEDRLTATATTAAAAAFIGMSQTNDHLNK